MNKMFVKILIAFVSIICVMTTLILIFSFSAIRSQYIDTLETNLTSLNIVLSENFLPILESGNNSCLDSLVKVSSKKIHARITIINPSGKVLADSEKDPSTMENHASRTEFELARLNNYGSSIRFSTTVKEEMLYVAMPIVKNGELIAFSRVSLFVNDIDKLYSEIELKIIQITLIIMFLSMMAIFIFSRNLTKPILGLTKASLKVASGDFNTKVLFKTKGELKVLAQNFNRMTERINNLFGQISKQKDELDGIISSMQEGLVVIAKDNTIVMANKSFYKIVKEINPLGKNFWEYLKDNNVVKLVSWINKKKQSKTTEIRVNNSYYLCSGNYIESKENTVLVLYDISKKKNLENIKKDFVVNISHELRTPLTSIKGFLETMEDSANKEQKKYLDIINRNTNRLIDIVKDLLTISELENVKNLPTYTETNIEDIVNNSFKLFEKQMKEKKLYYKIDISNDIESFLTDNFKLEQMFINLIGNAVNYTDKGYITVSAKKSGNYIIINVEDTGCGIPKEYTDRIFERFFTVNKSRSRDKGGTGLGLSIVKHIVQLHDASINVESIVNKGSIFTIKFPLKRED